jgi:hypothetical protein
MQTYPQNKWRKYDRYVILNLETTESCNILGLLSLIYQLNLILPDMR